jgi:23S rRNA pseudouridine1911/1915/1917 synthase
MGREARSPLARHGVAVLHEDNHVLGVSKPAGLLAQGGPKGVLSLVDLVEAYRRETEGKPGRAYVGLVHRLDRNVSGALVIAKTSKAASRLSEAFRERSPGLRKTYLAWVEGVPLEPRGVLEHRLTRAARVTREADEGDEDARPARLVYEVEGWGPNVARLRIDLETGVSHQIRAQLAAAGHPILGDEKYGGPRGDRPALHALRLAFPHPVGGRPVELVAPVPEDLVLLDRALGLRPAVSA